MYIACSQHSADLLPRTWLLRVRFSVGHSTAIKAVCSVLVPKQFWPCEKWGFPKSLLCPGSAPCTTWIMLAPADSPCFFPHAVRVPKGPSYRRGCEEQICHHTTVGCTCGLCSVALQGRGL